MRDRERRLREALTGADPTGAALELAALLCSLERHREAVDVLEVARRKVDDDGLLVTALAGVWRDLGQRHRAVAVLRGLRSRHGPLALHPGLLCELAELEWLEGDRRAAASTLREVRELFADSRWLAEHTAAVAELGREIANGGRPRRLKIRDLLGNLRGAPAATARLATLDELLRLIRAPDSPVELRALERRVLAIGGGDDDPAVRARAVQLGPATSDAGDASTVEAFLEAALGDEDPLVRSAAAARAVELLGDRAESLLQTWRTRWES